METAQSYDIIYIQTSIPIDEGIGIITEELEILDKIGDYLTQIIKNLKNILIIN